MEERELVPIVQRRVASRLLRHLGDHALERAIEAPRERLAPQHLEPRRMRQHVRGIAGGRERRERERIAREHVRAVDDERGHARRRPIGRPCDDRELNGVTPSGDDEPEQVRRSRGEARNDRRHALAERQPCGALDEQRAQRTRAGDDARIARHVAHAERGARLGVERKRGSGEARGGRDGGERDDIRGGGEQLGGGAECEHAAP